MEGLTATELGRCRGPLPGPITGWSTSPQQGALPGYKGEPRGYKVAVERDGHRLGAWNGGVDDLTLSTLQTEVDREEFHRNGVVLMAQKIRDLGQHGELRSEYRQAADLIPLSRAEVTNVVPPRDEEWQPAELVLEFGA